MEIQINQGSELFHQMCSNGEILPGHRIITTDIADGLVGESAYQVQEDYSFGTDKTPEEILSQSEWSVL
ncbi:hypothetical protein HN832_03810 [archaeon]|nr:hypothetical protein [archaeon]MBT4373480.1 hypothetical protein [archaeon]MBT4531928.1 hypothetical protein [archaeon]MBT7001595.1 hypothetical protein [archaeon]MBT7282513.1 hypothetical protein [archaeon]